LASIAIGFGLGALSSSSPVEARANIQLPLSAASQYIKNDPSVALVQKQDGHEPDHEAN
jgi:hypothetical protein